MTSKINYIQKNRIQYICVIRICGLYYILTIEKNKYEKKYYKDFYCIKCYIKSTNYIKSTITNIWRII